MGTVVDADILRHVSNLGGDGGGVSSTSSSEVDVDRKQRRLRQRLLVGTKLVEQVVVLMLELVAVGVVVIVVERSTLGRGTEEGVRVKERLGLR